MGGAELQVIEDYLPAGLRSQVDLRFSTCLDHCRKEGAFPPFAEVDGRLISGATAEKIRTELERVLEEQDHDCNE